MELAQPAIVITQGALREVIRHLSSSPDQELLGFLIGEPCECPKTKRRFLCITGTLRTGHAIAEEEPVQIPDAEWLGQQLEVRRRRSTLIGWYHSTPFLSPSPSRSGSRDASRALHGGVAVRARDRHRGERARGRILSRARGSGRRAARTFRSTSRWTTTEFSRAAVFAR